jgi:hypothetical protein
MTGTFQQYDWAKTAETVSVTADHTDSADGSSANFKSIRDIGVIRGPTS